MTLISGSAQRQLLAAGDIAKGSVTMNATVRRLFVALGPLSVLLTGTAWAADCEDTTVVHVLAAPSSCATGSLAFRTRLSGGSLTPWQCVAKIGTNYSVDDIEAINKVVTMAHLSGRKFNYSTSSASCTSSDYTTSVTVAWTNSE